MAFEARYPDTCAGCFDPIKVGDVVTYEEGELVVHTDCRSRDSLFLGKVQAPCQSCWLVHAGECL